ncbi:hypothetical protein AN403_5987 [Pseudomonas fluorescens]|uniref:Uncharacterized protein n=1 Tax=Pseudomonas fluorescens TaxID=294 RepID=A0A0P8ZWE3_PSEFL|nr:hypothetical protein AN403_5987 [Pseudomonas fluorescens]
MRVSRSEKSNRSTMRWFDFVSGGPPVGLEFVLRYERPLWTDSNRPEPVIARKHKLFVTINGPTKLQARHTGFSINSAMPCPPSTPDASHWRPRGDRRVSTGNCELIPATKASAMKMPGDLPGIS